MEFYEKIFHLSLKNEADQTFTFVYFSMERKLSGFTCKSDLESITDSYNFLLIGEL